MSCLITEHRQYNDVDYPPSIVISPSALYLPNTITQVDLTTVVGPSIHFDVLVRDPNVNQDLQAHVVLDKDVSDPRDRMLHPYPIHGMGALNRSFGFDVILTDLDPTLMANQCHKVELLVSSNFGASERTPVDPTGEDFASMTWWIALTDGSGTAINMIAPFSSGGCR